MIKKLILLSAMLLAISSCTESQMAYENFVEGQDVYLECYEEGSRVPHWYSFDTSTEGESTGYHWPSSPMKRFELEDVFIKPTEITFKEGSDSTTYLNRKDLTMGYRWLYQCYSIGFQNAKNNREKRFEELTKNNKI